MEQSLDMLLIGGMNTEKTLKRVIHGISNSQEVVACGVPHLWQSANSVGPAVAPGWDSAAAETSSQNPSIGSSLHKYAHKFKILVAVLLF